MSTIQTEQFTDNWAYLKTELAWLDRVLMLAVARQRKEIKEIDRFAQSRVDRVTSHWWKGLISLEGDVAYDEHRKSALPTSGSTTKLGYQQQLEIRIKASHQQGIVLGLPLLRDRLELTVFEKNVVLLSLAPEVNRRYARLYRYLQGEDVGVKTDLPTVDLALRLLCRNDHEWCSARTQLTSASPLVRYDLLKLLPQRADTLLNYPFKLADSLVDYLLAERPTAQGLEVLLQPASPSPPLRLLSNQTAIVDWSELVLPAPLLASLQHLYQRLQLHTQLSQWGFEQQGSGLAEPGAVVLLAGGAGTGKTTAAGAIAHTLQKPMTMVNLALIDPLDYPQLLQEITTQAPTVLLVKSAHLWFGRSSSLTSAQINQFLAQRQRMPGVTLLSVSARSSVKLHWQQQFAQILEFPLPNRSDRLRLWQQAFPTQVPLNPEIDWELLAEQLPISGGEIRAIAREAALYLAASGEPALGMSHLTQALEQQGKTLKTPPTKIRSTRKRTSSKRKKRQ